MSSIKDLIKSIEAADSSFDEKLDAINKMEETLVAMRQQEEQAVQDNVDLIVEAIKVMENKVTAQLEVAKSIVPEKGDKGDKGDGGLDGRQGIDGKNGLDGRDGKDGIDGKDGVSVTDAKIDFDGSLVISLSTGQEINVGEVVAPELQERIKLVTSGGAGISESGVATLTNKRIDPRDVTATTATTLTPDVSVGDIYCFTALASALTINAPIGTPTNGEKLIFRLLDNGTSRTLTWDTTSTGYTVIGVTLPTATTISKTTYVGCIYNANNTRWDVIAVTTQA
jgi:hypothetical protein